MSTESSGEFVKLLLKHQDALLRFILPLVGRLEDAQDVLQETAAALWKKFDDYDTAQPFLPWARRFAKYEVLMHHRRKRRYTFLSESLVDVLAEERDRDAAVDFERREALDDCLEKLPDPDRHLVEKRYADRTMTIQKLAADTGESANVLYKSLARIRRQLLECVTQRVAADG